MLKKSLYGVILACFVFSFAVVSSYGADAKNEEGLRKAFDAYIQASRERDVSAMTSMLGEEIMVTDPTAPTGIALTKDQRARELEDYYKDCEKYQIRVGVSDLFIVGNTGVVYGLFSIRKYPPRQFYDVRFMMTFSYMDGKWLLVNETRDSVKISGFDPIF